MTICQGSIPHFAATSQFMKTLKLAQQLLDFQRLMLMLGQTRILHTALSVEFTLVRSKFCTIFSSLYVFDNILLLMSYLLRLCTAHVLKTLYEEECLEA